MKKWLISAITLTFALGAAGALTAFALTGDGGDTPELSDGTESAGEISPGLPRYDEWLSDFGGQKVVTSIDDIDPNVCNLVHNITPCTPEELGELGLVPAAGSIAVGEPDSNTEIEGNREPLFAEGEPVDVQTTARECAPDQGVYVTSDGQVGCVDVTVPDDRGQGPAEDQPAMVPQILPAAE
jgi:hypothetical protein